MNRWLALLVVALMLAAPARALEIKGVTLPESVKVGDQDLVLNGAGLRSKFFVKVYIGALYLREKTPDAAKAVAMPGAKRVHIHVLYDEVDRKALVDAWNDGFRNNLPQAELQALKPRIDQFNALFETARKGDVILLDYLPGVGTRVNIGGQEKGVVPGEDFNQAMLRIWLGERPADADLKQGMLGG